MYVEETGSVSNVVKQGTMLREKENMIKELLEESQTAFKELKEEMVVSRTESQTNEELDIMRSGLRELPTNNSKLLSQAEYNEERFFVLSAKAQTALEDKNKARNLTTVKHEQTIMDLEDEVLVAPDKHYKTERSLESLRRQYQLLQVMKARLSKEREVLNREKHNQGNITSKLGIH
jgi:hypothetical protein